MMNARGGLKKDCSGSKSVSFDSNVAIREFPMILGDNPAVSSGGPPIQLDWEPQNESTKNMDLYEYLKADRRRKRPYLTSNERQKIVQNAGYTKEEINDAIVGVLQIRKLRTESMEETGGWDRFKKIFAKQLHGTFKSLIGSKPKSSSARTA
jgi:hypothetical protein